jgi:hypothetical protein
VRGREGGAGAVEGNGVGGGCWDCAGAAPKGRVGFGEATTLLGGCPPRLSHLPSSSSAISPPLDPSLISPYLCSSLTPVLSCLFFPYCLIPSYTLYQPPPHTHTSLHCPVSAPLTPTTTARPPRRSGNHIGDDGARALAAALPSLGALKILDLRYLRPARAPKGRAGRGGGQGRRAGAGGRVGGG